MLQNDVPALKTWRYIFFVGVVLFFRFARRDYLVPNQNVSVVETHNAILSLCTVMKALLQGKVRKHKRKNGFMHFQLQKVVTLHVGVLYSFLNFSPRGIIGQCFFGI